MFPCTLDINSYTCQTSELTLNIERSSRSLDGDNLSSTSDDVHILQLSFCPYIKIRAYVLVYYAVYI